MTAEHEPELSPIFIAASPAEADFVERLLDDEGIEFAIRPEAFLRAPIGGVCLLGILFEVRAGQAHDCRRLLESRGLARGVVEPDDAP